MSEFTIETGIEIPSVVHAGGAGRKPKYPFAELEVGQSFLVANPPKRLNVQVSAWGKKLGRSFVTRTNTDGTARVWRIEKPLPVATTPPTE